MELEEKYKQAIWALKRLTFRIGAHSRNQHQHAENCLTDMTEFAKSSLNHLGEKVPFEGEWSKYAYPDEEEE